MEEWEAAAGGGGKWKRTDDIEIRNERKERNWEEGEKERKKMTSDVETVEKEGGEEKVYRRGRTE